jgi:hypothetical protein
VHQPTPVKTAGARSERSFFHSSSFLSYVWPLSFLTVLSGPVVKKIWNPRRRLVVTIASRRLTGKVYARQWVARPRSLDERCCCRARRQLDTSLALVLYKYSTNRFIALRMAWRASSLLCFSVLKRHTLSG